MFTLKHIFFDWVTSLLDSGNAVKQAAVFLQEYIYTHTPQILKGFYKKRKYMGETLWAVHFIQSCALKISSCIFSED